MINPISIANRAPSSGGFRVLHTSQLSSTMCASSRDRISGIRNEQSRVAPSLNNFVSFPFFFYNSLTAAGSSVSRALAASGSRSYVSRAIRRDYRPHFFRAVIPRWYRVKMIIPAALPFTGSITTRCEDQSLTRVARIAFSPSLPLSLSLTSSETSS